MSLWIALFHLASYGFSLDWSLVFHIFTCSLTMSDIIAVYRITILVRQFNATCLETFFTWAWHKEWVVSHCAAHSHKLLRFSLLWIATKR